MASHAHYVNFTNFKGSSNWLDSPDLKTKYKGKEEQAQNIKDNARTFDHPILKVRLYEDIEFKGERGMSHKRKSALHATRPFTRGLFAQALQRGSEQKRERVCRGS